jgi:hypothetical protein
MIVDINRIRELSRRAQAGLAAALLGLLTATPLLVPSSVMAAPALAERELQSTSAVPSTTTDLTWIFDTTSAVANINQVEIEFCDSPLGSCAVTKVPTIAASPTATLSNFTSNTVTSTTRTNGDAGGTNSNQIVIVKTTADAGASLDEASISLAASDITNNATANATYYTRMRVYSDTGTTLVWEGVFAQSTSRTLTVNARVQERLDFCVGSTAIDDATTAMPNDCATFTGASGSTVDVGNIDSGAVNVTPVTTTNGGSNQNGAAMIRTNAVSGAVIDYRALQNNSSGKLKVPGATCSGTSTTDQCFNSTGTTSNTIVAGAEEFGLVVAGVNCTSASAYTCNFGTGSYNLVRDTEYDGEASANNNYVATTGGGQMASISALFAWDDTGTVDRIASSAGSAVKVLDDEALILKFAATAGITTPTGAYSVQADFIATTTF